jgi:hypothetical protein
MHLQCKMTFRCNLFNILFCDSINQCMVPEKTSKSRTNAFTELSSKELLHAFSAVATFLQIRFFKLCSCGNSNAKRKIENFSSVVVLFYCTILYCTVLHIYCIETVSHVCTIFLWHTKQMCYSGSRYVIKKSPNWGHGYRTWILSIAKLYF